MDFRKVTKAAKDQGWSIDATKSGHPRFTNPQGEWETFSGTPSDVRAIHNFVQALRRKGFEWPPPSKKQLRAKRKQDE